MTDDDEPDLFGSRSERDKGFERVGRLDWKLTALSFFKEHCTGEAITEAWRLKMLRAGCPAPHSPNAWGEFWKWAGEMGWIVKTGRLSQMRLRSSHARMTPVWRRVR